VIKSIDWILCPTDSFEQTAVFFREVLGLSPVASGVPVADVQFARYAQFTAPDQTTLEVVEPTPTARPFFRGPVLCMTVADLAGARAELVAKGVEFVTPVITPGDGWGWTYLRAPGGQVFQLHGPWSAPA